MGQLAEMALTSGIRPVTEVGFSVPPQAGAPPIENDLSVANTGLGEHVYNGYPDLLQRNDPAIRAGCVVFDPETGSVITVTNPIEASDPIGLGTSQEMRSASRRVLGQDLVAAHIGQRSLGSNATHTDIALLKVQLDAVETTEERAAVMDGMRGVLQRRAEAHATMRPETEGRRGPVLESWRRGIAAVRESVSLRKGPAFALRAASMVLPVLVRAQEGRRS